MRTKDSYVFYLYSLPEASSSLTPHRIINMFHSPSNSGKRTRSVFEEN